VDARCGGRDTKPRGGGAGADDCSGFAEQTGQHFGQYVPRAKTGVCIFSAWPPHCWHGPFTVAD
jgi:hypothetical protein